MPKRLRKVSDQQVRAIRSSSESASVLAARYGVQRSFIYRVRNRTRKGLVPDLTPETINLGPPGALGSMKPSTVIAQLHKDIEVVKQRLAAGEIDEEFANRELSWMGAVLDHWRREIARDRQVLRTCHSL